MMATLIARLRASSYGLGAEAAAEIERLRGQNILMKVSLVIIAIVGLGSRLVGL